MANNKKGSWKKERASVEKKSNKYRRTADKSKRSPPASSYWRAAYTRKDGTHVKGHYVRKSR
jgi:hypothetical protein